MGADDDLVAMLAAAYGRAWAPRDQLVDPAPTGSLALGDEEGATVTLRQPEIAGAAAPVGKVRRAGFRGQAN